MQFRIPLEKSQYYIKNVKSTHYLLNENKTTTNLL